MRDAGEIDFSIESHHAGSGAVEWVVETIRVDRRVIAFAIAITVFNDSDHFRVFREIFHGLLIRKFLCVFFQHFQTFGGGGELVVIRHPWVAAVVLDAPLESMGLGDVEAVLIVESDGGGIWTSGSRAKSLVTIPSGALMLARMAFSSSTAGSGCGFAVPSVLAGASSVSAEADRMVNNPTEAVRRKAAERWEILKLMGGDCSQSTTAYDQKIRVFSCEEMKHSNLSAQHRFHQSLWSAGQ